MNVIRTILKKLFNSNTGYFVASIPYDYEGFPYRGYTLYKGYVFFGLPGTTRVAVCSSKDQLYAWLKFLDIENIEIPE